MLKLTVSKELFEDILTTKLKIIEKEASQYWKKELFEIRLIDDNLDYQIKKINKLFISNGLGEEKPSLVVQCLDISVDTKHHVFRFHLGKIIEQRNIEIEDNYKDSLIQQLLKEKELLQEQMHKDYLTQVYNRQKMDEDIQKFTTQNNAKYLSAVLIDIDDFKNVNHTYGHDIGDKILKAIASKLKTHANRLNANVYRYGGEEFIMLCFLPQEQLLQSLEYVRKEIKEQKLLLTHEHIVVTVSMGISFWNNHKNVEAFLKEADKCVYKAKHTGKDKIVVTYT
jgi:diguanylate cyclase (GGDEF)-like protein